MKTKRATPERAAHLINSKDKHFSTQYQVVRKGFCPHTHFRAGYYSTNKELFIKPEVSQLNLFDL